ncbi:hypothetical protein C8R48DRAFT_673974 [Suillus tomentosus]|nr:hypothetical protein C8R48DRAFT_673974 [Suillus tomentosus]
MSPKNHVAATNQSFRNLSDKIEHILGQACQFQLADAKHLLLTTTMGQAITEVVMTHSSEWQSTSTATTPGSAPHLCGRRSEGMITAFKATPSSPPPSITEENLGQHLLRPALHKLLPCLPKNGGEALSVASVPRPQVPIAEAALQFLRSSMAGPGPSSPLMMSLMRMSWRHHLIKDGLRLDVRWLSYDATATQKAALQEKQLKLAAQITKFHKITDQLIEGVELDWGTVHVDDPRFCMAEADEQAWKISDEDNSELIDEEIPTEDMVIWMPSSVTHDHTDVLGLAKLQKEELALRKGQANDCLENIQLDLGQKTVIYRQYF